jgi:hypothetical protein
MELCPKCNRMTAERNHYTKEIICYNRFCTQESVEREKTKELDKVNQSGNIEKPEH